MEIKNQSKTTASKETNKPAPVWKKRTAAIARWLHVYLSMVSFVVVLFFSVTGITLNHTEWFEGNIKENKFAGTLPENWVNTTDTAHIKKLEIAELLRKEFSIKGYVSDFLVQDDQCSISFKGPGYSADAFINRKNGHFQLTEFKLGLMAVLNDLHKGRDSGNGWSWLIDVSAVLLILVSVSGLVMLFFLKKKRVSGLWLMIIGGILCYIVYWMLVP